MSLLLQSVLIGADDDFSTTLSSDEDYYDYDEPKTNVLSNSTHHWANCTFNGEIYFDAECTEWMRNFYIILSISLAGIAIFIAFVIFFRKKSFTNDFDDTERLVESN